MSGAGYAASGASRMLHPVAETADGRDGAGAELLPQTRDEDLDGVGVAVAVVRIDVIQELALRDHTSAMVHEIGKDAELVRGQMHGRTTQGRSRAARIEHDGAAAERGHRLSAGAPDESTHAREHFLHLKRLR